MAKKTAHSQKSAGPSSARDEAGTSSAELVDLPRKSITREYAEAIAFALVLAFFIRTFAFQAFKIPSGSMLPTLLIGDMLLVNKASYGYRIPFVGGRVLDFYGPERDDVVVFIYPADPSKDFIKRVRALPGETIEIKKGVVYINGEVLPDPHAHFAAQKRHRQGPADNFGPLTVPEGHVFVLGDNRDYSHDSRFWGTVPIDQIRGKAVVLYWSWDSEISRPRLGRIGDWIP